MLPERCKWLRQREVRKKEAASPPKGILPFLKQVFATFML
jgi:hypothetical protein